MWKTDRLTHVSPHFHFRCNISPTIHTLTFCTPCKAPLKIRVSLNGAPEHDGAESQSLVSSAVLDWLRSGCVHVCPPACCATEIYRVAYRWFTWIYPTTTGERSPSEQYPAKNNFCWTLQTTADLLLHLSIRKHKYFFIKTHQTDASQLKYVLAADLIKFFNNLDNASCRYLFVMIFVFYVFKCQQHRKPRVRGATETNQTSSLQNKIYMTDK